MASGRDRKAALHHVAGRLECGLGVADLLRCALPVQVNLRDLAGRAPLFECAAFGNVAAAAALLGRPELDMDAQDLSGRTALDVACRQGKHEVAALIRAERARRGRVTNAARVFALFQRVRDGDTATTPATQALLGVGAFVFDARCIDALVPDILLWAAEPGPAAEASLKMGVV